MTEPPSPLRMLLSRHTRRRDFITLVGGGAATWPLAARAQQAERLRRIGVLTNLAADEPDMRARMDALRQGLTELGWRENQTLQIDIRWGADDADGSRRQAAELLALAPDVVVATTTAKVDLLRQTTRTLPIVFAGVSDPVGAGLVTSLARPGGNITGFALPEYGISVKWLELLKEIAPRVARVGVLSGFGTTPGIGQLAALQAVAPSMRVDLTPLVVGDADEIEAAVRAFSSAPNRGLILLSHRND